jgi:hypothetical protein
MVYFFYIASSASLRKALLISSLLLASSLASWRAVRASPSSASRTRSFLNFNQFDLQTYVFCRPTLPLVVFIVFFCIASSFSNCTWQVFALGSEPPVKTCLYLWRLQQLLPKMESFGHARSRHSCRPELGDQMQPPRQVVQMVFFWAPFIILSK